MLLIWYIVMASLLQTTVLVSFYLAAVDDTVVPAPEPRRDKFDVPPSCDEQKDLFNLVKHFKTFTGLAEIGENTDRGHDCQIVLFYCTEVQKSYFSFAGDLENTSKFKISIERANLHLTFISSCRIMIRLDFFNFFRFFWERKLERDSGK